MALRLLVLSASLRILPRCDFSCECSTWSRFSFLLLKAFVVGYLLDQSGNALAEGLGDYTARDFLVLDRVVEQCRNQKCNYAD